MMMFGLSFSYMALVVIPVLILFFSFVFVARQYKRCPSNKVLVIYGRTSGAKTSRCIHGGGQLVIPLIQDYTYLSLEPITIDIALNGALSKKNIRVNVPSTFTIGICTQPEVLSNAAERLLGLSDESVANQAKDIILGQLRLVIATLSIEEINQDREKFLDLINQNVNIELHKIGLEVINVNIRDIHDESGYIEAIGKKAAAEAINRAKVEVAQQERDGAVGEETALSEQTINVAQRKAEAVIGENSASTREKVETAKLVTTAEVGEKDAERERRILKANYEAEAVKGENESRGEIASYNAELAQKEAQAKRLGEVAKAESLRDILIAEKEAEIAHLEKVELAKQEVEKKKIQVDAEAEAERLRCIARGEADSILARYAAEAEGIQKVLQAKAEGYRNLMESCGDQKELAPTLLMIEKLPELVKEQVKAIQNISFDKITVWENGAGASDGSGSTANFLRSVAGMLPPVHELAKQAGVELPGYMGKVSEKKKGISSEVEAADESSKLQ